MAEPNQPSELAPTQSGERHPFQDRTQADEASEEGIDEGLNARERGQPVDFPERGRQAAGPTVFGDTVSTPAPEGKFLISPEQAQAREAAERMGVFRGLSRELNEKEWNSGGTRKLILERIARLESELIELKDYRSQYHGKDKECAVLRQQLRQLTAADRLSDFCLAVGGVLTGLATFLFDQGHWVLGLVVLLIGTVLLVWPLWLKHNPKSD